MPISRGLAGAVCASLVVAVAVTILSLVNCEQDKSSVNRLVVISSAPAATVDDDTFVRFNRSVEAYGLKLELLRPDAAGPQIDSYSVGLESGLDLRDRNRKQLESLRALVSLYKGDQDAVLLLLLSLPLADGASSSIVNGNEQAILSRFEEFHRANGTRILFSADRNCWPDASLANEYPPAVAQDLPPEHQQRFLSSRALIGFAPTIWEWLELILEGDEQQIGYKSNYNLQLSASRVYLAPELRQRLKLELDQRSSLFENLDRNSSSSGDGWSSSSGVELEFVNATTTGGAADDEVALRNLIHNSRPLVVHASSAHAKIELASLGNYLGRAWTPRAGCRWCNASMISLAGIKNSDLPSVLIGVFIEEPTPFMESFFAALAGLNYPKERLHLLVHNSQAYHEKQVGDFLAVHGPQYASQQLMDFRSQPAASEWEARERALRRCQELGCHYYLSLDSVARLEWPETLRTLIETNRTIVAPLLSRPGKLWSNFWAAMTRDGYYARSHDYVELVAREREGVWAVPLVMNAYLIEGKFLRQSLSTVPAPAADDAQQTGEWQQQQQQRQTAERRLPLLAYHDVKFPEVKSALIFARNLRASNGVLQFVNNLHDFGHLVDPTDYNITHRYPDLYQLEANRHDWEREYLHENYTDLFDERDEDERNYPNRVRLEEPCRDVYWFPLVNEKFCDQLVDMMERFGQWSSGTNSDPRIEGGYESVPTRDIHFKQVGLHQLWLTFLREYVMPVQLKEYIGYEHDPPRTDLAFVVRYHPSEQPSLRPHHDSSTYTLNIALNAPGRDYEGGGCRFVRYNCSVTESRKGWALIHPGRLTHYHEGLPVTRGTRYILVTFIDP